MIVVVISKSLNGSPSVNFSSFLMTCSIGLLGDLCGNFLGLLGDFGDTGNTGDGVTGWGGSVESDVATSFWYWQNGSDFLLCTLSDVRIFCGGGIGLDKGAFKCVSSVYGWGGVAGRGETGRGTLACNPSLLYCQ